MNISYLDHLIFSLALLAALLCSVYSQSCTSYFNYKPNDTCTCDGWTSVPKNVPQSTELLDLSGNSIAVIHETSFQDLANLKVLKLQYNNLTYIDQKSFRKNQQLVKIYLSENILEVLSYSLFEENSKLKCVILRKNLRLGSYISELKSSFLISKSLESLDLSNCEITNLGVDLFSRTPSLKSVDLSVNKIVHLDSKTISPLRMLREFYLNWNPILNNSCAFNDLTAKYSNVDFELTKEKIVKKKTCMLSDIRSAVEVNQTSENITTDKIEKTTIFQFLNTSSVIIEVTKPVEVFDTTVKQQIEVAAEKRFIIYNQSRTDDSTNKLRSIELDKFSADNTSSVIIEVTKPVEVKQQIEVATEKTFTIYNQSRTDDSTNKLRSIDVDNGSSDKAVGSVDPLIIIVISNMNLLALTLIIITIACVIIKRRTAKTSKLGKAGFYGNTDHHYEEMPMREYVRVSMPPEVPPRPSERVEITPVHTYYDGEGYMMPRMFASHKYDQFTRLENDLLG